MLVKWLSFSTALLHGSSAYKLLDCPGLFNASKAVIPGLNPYVAAVYALPPLSDYPQVNSDISSC